MQKLCVVDAHVRNQDRNKEIYKARGDEGQATQDGFGVFH